MTPPLLSAERLCVDFAVRHSRKVYHAVKGVTFAVHAGESVGLVGESGSGKSTLARALVGLVPPTAGTCRFRGNDIAALDAAGMLCFRRAVQMVFQDPLGSLNPRMRVGQAIGEVLRVHRRAPDGSPVAHPRSDDERVAELLERVGLDGSYGRRYPHELSGGQRQRVVLARSLAVHPEVLIADEPVSALDVLIQKQVLELMVRLHREAGLALVLIAHDLAVVRSACRRLVVLRAGEIVEEGPTDEVIARPSHPYTRALIAAVPDIASGLRRRSAL
jgi:peptide/nickel transport system ATP-binding protein